MEGEESLISYSSAEHKMLWALAALAEAWNRRVKCKLTCWSKWGVCSSIWGWNTLHVPLFWLTANMATGKKSSWNCKILTEFSFWRKGGKLWQRWATQTFFYVQILVLMYVNITQTCATALLMSLQNWSFVWKCIS